MTTKNNSGIKVKANIKAGGFNANHSRNALKIKTGLKAGEGILSANHTRAIG